MVQSSASSALALPRFLLSLSASSTSSQQLHGPANEADACSRIAPASPPDSACRSTSQDIELVALHPWNLNTPSAAAVPRIVKHKRASLSLPAVSSPSALPERKSASASRSKMASPNTLTKQQKFRGGVWAVAFAAIIMVGTLTGAQLKSDKQKEQSIKEFRQITPSEQKAMLEKQRSTLVEQRSVLQKKLDVFRERVQERQQEQENSKKR
ncbi:hypothetical protein V8C40DRAFT_273861 [Trichoderma camerunense]